MNNNLSCKVFVGNVPFQCEQEEFNKCFENMKGFIKAEVIYKQNSDITRGFGFVTFDTIENAKLLVGNTHIMIKNRALRFTEYMFDNWKEHNNHYNVTKKQNKHILIENIKLKTQNLIIMKNIDKTITRENIYEIFSKLGQIGKYFIATDHETGKPKNYAVIEILDNELYESLLRDKKIEVNSHTYEISKWFFY